jgi:sec-independent protein translocase protein TatA
MGLDNPIHIAILLVILLLVFGAKRLPEMGHSLGAGLRGFKDSLSGEHTPDALASATPPPSITPVPSATPIVAEHPTERDGEHARTASAA